MKVHLYPLADPNNPDDKCSVEGCKNKAGIWWPLLGIALCQFHHEFPPKGRFKDLVTESQEGPDDFDYPDYTPDVYGG